MPIVRSLSNCRCSLWFPYECGSGCVLSRGRLRTRPPPHSYGNQRLQRQFDRLLMMGIIMPETCWAVSVRQSNKILRLTVASSWVFYLIDWRCMEPQTLIWCTILFSHMFIPNLYMFRTLLCSSSGELIAYIRHLVYVTLCRWPSGMQVWVRQVGHLQEFIAVSIDIFLFLKQILPLYFSTFVHPGIFTPLQQNKKCTPILTY